MPAQEITFSLQLTDEQASRTALHSFHNVLAVVMGELQMIEKILDRRGALRASLELCRDARIAFGDREKALASVAALESARRTIEGEIAALVDQTPVAPEHAALLQSSVDNLRGILNVAEVRVREILARQEAPGRWERISTAEIRSKLMDVMQAIVRNAHGAYGIVDDPARQTERDYLLGLTIESVDGETITLPPVLTDVLRDLVANARKYSLPGSRIDARLIDNGQEILLEVADQGRGIPEGEIPGVVRYGVRGSNTLPKETSGGGFGLTKAYYVTKQFGGRLWIDSELGRGTCITIRLPRAG